MTKDTRDGILLATAGFWLWGLSVLFYKILDHVPALEVIAHRTLWSVVFAGAWLVWRRSWLSLGEAFRSPRLLATLGLTSTLVAVNWLVFVWAIAVSRVMEVSIGYYINPLVNVLLGVVLLGEPMTRLQGLSLVLAAAAVALLVFLVGDLPWVALVLALSFSFYGYLRKQLPVKPAEGLFVEVVLLAPFAALYVAYVEGTGVGHWSATPWTPILLICTGPMTAVPLIFYAAAAKRMRLSLLGVLFYMTPTLHFIMGVIIIGEPMSWQHVVVFLLIWLAVGLFARESLRAERGMDGGN